MKLTSSYKAEVKNNPNFKATVELYRKAISFLITVCDAEWDSIVKVEGSKRRQIYVETLVHTTKNHMAKYQEFDVNFYKFPSYLRRAAISDAIGAVSSYHSNYANWEKGDQKTKPPRLQPDTHSMPVFYRDDCYKETDDPNVVLLKLFVRNDWRWVPARLRSTDIKYIQKKRAEAKCCAPVLEKSYGKYYLRFAFQQEVALSDTPECDRIVCAVDLGLNTDAVCVIMDSKGTVLARKFINFPSEKDLLYRVLNRIKKQQRKHGNGFCTRRWSYATNLNTDLGNKIAAAIVSFASRHDADVIVFEHLDMNGKKHGKDKQKLHMWRKNTIQAVATHKAHQLGMRVSRICAWGTSKLAFDGSGEVERDKDNHALCTFKTGKRYNCDLNAAYNIGARYYIRALLKPLRESVRSQTVAKVQGLERRTSNTLATLTALNSELETA